MGEASTPGDASGLVSDFSRSQHTFYLGLYPDTCLLGTQQEKKKSLRFPFPPKSGDTRRGAPMRALRASLALCCYHQPVTQGGEFNHRRAEQEGTGHQKGTGHQSTQHGQGCCKTPWKMPRVDSVAKPRRRQHPAHSTLWAPCPPERRSGGFQLKIRIKILQLKAALPLAFNPGGF